MANPWFRVYSEFATDPKVQSMSEAMQRRLMMLMCLRCSDVLATLQDDELQFALHISESELDETKALFVRKGFADSEWNLLNWDKRQFNSDSSTERSRKSREAKKATSEIVETLRNVAATPPDTDTDTDTEERETREVSRSRSDRSKTLTTYIADCKAQGVKPIPDDHSIRTFMVDSGISDEMAQIAWVRFREEHLTGARKAKRYVDWPATFANSVKDRWYRLWTVPAEGDAQWTSEGHQARRAIEATHQQHVQEAA